ncbi:ComF family protein [Candidatus Kaiserbacteria bacterium]|nr:ComF family protein [Candidatus Kaiserbacteria bacterium]
MPSLFTKLFDILFPPSPELRIVRATTAAAVCVQCRPMYEDGIYALTHFKDGTMRALIHEAKFHHNAHALALLGTLFAHGLTHLPLPDANFLILPIPLSPARKRERGYNQVAEVLHAAARERSLAIDAHTLVRTRHTKPQTELSREERLHNMKDAFAVRTPERIAGAHIIVVDDVYTTGATLRAAKAALLPHTPASVTCLALAH